MKNPHPGQKPDPETARVEFEIRREIAVANGDHSLAGPPPSFVDGNAKPADGKAAADGLDFAVDLTKGDSAASAAGKPASSPSAADDDPLAEDKRWRETEARE